MSSDVAQQISEDVGKKWKSAWLIPSSEKYYWFTINHIYWERNQTAIEVSDNPRVWLETDSYILTVKEKKILLSDTEWLNNNIMDAAQKLICKALGRLESHQLVLNWQKRVTPFFNISEEHFQFMHKSPNHWLISFRSNDRIQIYDSLYTNLTPVIKNCLKALYKAKVEKMGKYQLP